MPRIFPKVILVTLAFPDNCDLHLKISPEGLDCEPIPDEGFSYLSAGARATWGVTQGKVCFECKVSKSETPSDDRTFHSLNIIIISLFYLSGLCVGFCGPSRFRRTKASCPAWLVNRCMQLDARFVLQNALCPGLESCWCWQLRTRNLVTNSQVLVAI